jgi:rSAM/selenodomain-associated transferase 2
MQHAFMSNQQDSGATGTIRPDEPWLSVIVPARNEAAGIADTLAPLQSERDQGVEVVLVDGASTDATREQAEPWVDRFVDAAPGRAHQMNQGAAGARAPLLWFLHADTRMDARHLQALKRERGPWGHFRVRLSGRHPLFRVISFMMNLRSRLTGISTGDQSLFVCAELFREEGGFPEQPLMEDVAFSARLRRRAGRPAQLVPALTTDSRRWESRGPWRTMIEMWWLRWRYWRGDDPAVLCQRYERETP